jgi:hypothetical protein
MEPCEAFGLTFHQAHDLMILRFVEILNLNMSVKRNTPLFKHRMVPLVSPAMSYYVSSFFTQWNLLHASGGTQSVSFLSFCRNSMQASIMLLSGV